MQEQMNLALEIAREVRRNDGRALFVGGYARDAALRGFGYNIDSKDIDIEVYGIAISQLLEVLKKFGRPNMIGAAFGIIKLGELDISIPRKDSKVGEGHRGFLIAGDPHMSVKEAARRRDFTINALALVPLGGEIIDHWGGLEDAAQKILRATDPELFKDDPLRVLRAMQFAGRFGFSIDPDTLKICREMDLSSLSKERIQKEWTKLLLKSPKPSIGLEAARELSVLEKLHPELSALEGTPQDLIWHPEGDVWIHTKMVVDEAATLVREKNLPDEQALVVLLAALCHDLGKPATTAVNDQGRVTSREHSEKGVEPTESFLKSVDMPNYVVEKVVPLVREHLFPSLNKDANNSAVKRLAHRLYPATIQELVMVGYSDHKGREIPWDGYPEGEELLRKAENLSLETSKPTPLLMGRDLILMGMAPGVIMGKVLKDVFELQLSDKIKTVEEARRFGLLYKELDEARARDISSVQLLNGEMLTKEEMIGFVKERFLDEGVHDMGTLTMFLLLRGETLPYALEKNKRAICTAHKFGPMWFLHLEPIFYETSWKSFYGRFEVDAVSVEEIKTMSCIDQATLGLDLIESPDENLVLAYDETFKIQPEASEKIYALFVTEAYPFEAGMIAGFRIMVQYNPKSKRISVSVLDESTDKVAAIDAQIRSLLPEFARAKKVGYLSASDSEGRDDVFSEEDARRIYKVLKSHAL